MRTNEHVLKMRFSALKRSVTTSFLNTFRHRLRNQTQRLRPLHTPRRINSTSDRETDANLKSSTPSTGPPIEVRVYCTSTSTTFKLEHSFE